MSGPGDGEKFVPTGFLACYRSSTNFSE